VWTGLKIDGGSVSGTACHIARSKQLIVTKFSACMYDRKQTDIVLCIAGVTDNGTESICPLA